MLAYRECLAEKGEVGRKMEMVPSRSKIITLDIFRIRKKKMFSGLSQYHLSAFPRLFRKPKA